jgi:hypothetical protein
MRDFLTALMGRRRCPWCVRSRGSTRIERFFDGYKFASEIRWFSKIYWWTVDPVGYKYIPIWRLGEKWHGRSHAD